MSRNAKLAVLIDPRETYPPSDQKALDYLANLAHEEHVKLDFLTKDDLYLLRNYNSLFIRTLTDKDNYTYQWALIAEFLNLKMIDTSRGISLGSDKHLQYELFKLTNLNMPDTKIVHYHTRDQFEKLASFKFPLVLKIPNGSFSNGVYKVDNLQELQIKLEQLFNNKKYYSLILQEYIYTEFDWRIGILNHKPLFVCKYYMVDNHWQVIKYKDDKIIDEGKFETLPIQKMPAKVFECVEKVASLLDGGLYGIDIKMHNNKAVIVEVNDNPNIYFGIEDLVEQERVYKTILLNLLNSAGD